MLTQLKQQDPTNPLKSHEMAAQLAQFSSVEQLTNMNQTLTKMSQKGTGSEKFDVLSLIGKMVKVVAWYDNEAGYSNRCVDLISKIG